MPGKTETDGEISVISGSIDPFWESKPTDDLIGKTVIAVGSYNKREHKPAKCIFFSDHTHCTTSNIYEVKEQPTCRR